MRHMLVASPSPRDALRPHQRMLHLQHQRPRHSERRRLALAIPRTRRQPRPRSPPASRSASTQLRRARWPQPALQRRPLLHRTTAAGMPRPRVGNRTLLRRALAGTPLRRRPQHTRPRRQRSVGRRIQDWRRPLQRLRLVSQSLLDHRIRGDHRLPPPRALHLTASHRRPIMPARLLHHHRPYPRPGRAACPPDRPTTLLHLLRHSIQRPARSNRSRELMAGATLSLLRSQLSTYRRPLSRHRRLRMARCHCRPQRRSSVR
jgi:hypothetical protein